jgi:DNA polymerase IV
VSAGVRSILHVDMDAFFASVEQRDDPSLRGKPVVVGGASARGVVAAASYEIRPFGVRSAMPMVQALRLCPHAIVVPPRHGRYAEVSAQVFAIFHRYTPLVEGLSLDEAFLDVTASHGLFGSAEQIARRIKEDIRRELHLNASIGIAPSKFAAKIASDLSKPDGLLIVPDDVGAFLAELPLERMWGVGPKAAERLHAARFRTIGDLAAATTDRLTELLGSWGAEVKQLASGVDPRDVIPDRGARSIGSEETFERDLRKREDLERKLLKHAREVARRLTREGLYGQVVRVKVKYADFSLRSRQRRLAEPVMDTSAIYGVARELLRELPAGRLGIRLVGVAMAELTQGPGQAKLFTDPGDERRQRLQTLEVQLGERFGRAALTRAALLDDPEE